MTDQPERKPTPTERVWEAFNAVLLKPPHRGSESTSYSTVTVGDMKGRTHVEVCQGVYVRTEDYEHAMDILFSDYDYRHRERDEWRDADDERRAEQVHAPHASFGGSDHERP